MLDSTVVCRRALGCEWGGYFQRTTRGLGCEGEVVRTVQILEATFVLEAGLVELTIMPNPARDWVTLQFGELNSGPAEVVLFDARGAQVMRVTTTGQINVSALSSGRYTLQATTALGRATQPLVVE